jgi:hypothetical protein
VHRASIDLADARLLGAIGSGVGAGRTYCPDRGTGVGPGPAAGFGNGPCLPGAAVERWGVGDLPDFYASRLGPLVVPGDRRWADRTFTDPVWTAGVGLHLHAGRHLVLQPEARVWVITANGHRRSAGAFGIAVGYGF